MDEDFCRQFMSMCRVSGGGAGEGEGERAKLPQRVAFMDLLLQSLESVQNKEYIEKHNLQAESMEFFMLDNQKIIVNLSMEERVAVRAVFYKELPKENWVMNENPMMTHKISWTSDKTKMVWAPEERRFGEETLETSFTETEANTLSILQTKNSLKLVTDHLSSLFHPKTVSLRIAIEHFPDWINCCAWSYGAKLTRIVVISMGARCTLPSNEFRFILEQGHPQKLLSFWCISPPSQFDYDKALPVAHLSVCGSSCWIQKCNLLSKKLEAVSIHQCLLYAEDLRNLIELFLEDYWPKLKFLDLSLLKGASKAKLEKRVLRGWNALPPDPNRRSRYFMQFSDSCFQPYDCKDFIDIESRNGALASVGVENEKFMLVVWHHGAPEGQGPTVSCRHADDEKY